MENSAKTRSGFEVIQDRSAGQKIHHIALSTKQDLVAYATGKGEVTIFNNDWMKVASYKPQDFLSGETVSALAWRPDGRAIAIAYSSCKLLVKNVETHETIAELNFDDQIDWLDWSPSYWTPEEMEFLSSKRQFDDQTQNYLQEVKIHKSASVSGGETSKEPEKPTAQLQMKNQRTLSVLSVITSAKKLHLYAFGFLPLALIDLQEGSESEITRVCQYYMSRDFEAVVIVVQDDSDLLWELVYDTSIIQRHFEELEILAKHSDYLLAYRKSLEISFKRLTTMKDDSWQELEDAIKLLFKPFEKEFDEAILIRPEIGKSETGAHFLLAALMEQIVLGIVHPALENFFEHSAPVQELVKYQASLEGTLKHFRKEIMLPFRQALECCLVSLTHLRRWVANDDRFRPIGATRAYFERVFQDCASFFLKMIEVQRVVERDARRIHITVSWLISQAETLNPPDHGATPRRFSETELDSVISVLKDLFDDDVPALTDPLTPHRPWKMRHFGVEAYFSDTDLETPLPDSYSTFQPFYDRLVDVLAENDARGFVKGPFLADSNADASDTETFTPFPQNALFAFHRTKTARQELTSFTQSLELTFANIVTVISQAITVSRREMLVDGCDGNCRVCISPAMPSDNDMDEGDGGKPNFIQLAWTEWEGGKQSLVVLKHALKADSTENDGRLTMECSLLSLWNPSWKNPVVLGLQALRTCFVVFVKNEPDGDVIMIPLESFSVNGNDQTQKIAATTLIQSTGLSGMVSLGTTTSPDLITSNGLLSVFAVLVSESRIRLFRIPDTASPVITDDTDKIAEEIRPDLAAMPIV